MRRAGVQRLSLGVPERQKRPHRPADVSGEPGGRREDRVVQVQEGKRLTLPLEKVGTRRRFYRRERPSGTEIDDIEWTLGQIESNAAPLLQSVDKGWPFSGDDKVKLSGRP
jgi:hypothetical protein